MHISIKDGVRFSSPQDAIAAAHSVVVEVFRERDAALVITSAAEAHRLPSKHPLGGARDYRLNHIQPHEEGFAIARTVRSRLGDGFYVKAHGEGPHFHLHVQYNG